MFVCVGARNEIKFLRTLLKVRIKILKIINAFLWETYEFRRFVARFNMVGKNAFRLHYVCISRLYSKQLSEKLKIGNHFQFSLFLKSFFIEFESNSELHFLWRDFGWNSQPFLTFTFSEYTLSQVRTHF